MAKQVVPTNLSLGLDVLTPAQRLFLFFYAQQPDIEWACEQAGCSKVTVLKKWKYQPAFALAWTNVIRGEITDLIRAQAKDQGAKSFSRIVELRDQDRNPRVALDAAKACLRAIEDPTFASRIKVTKDIGENWRRVLMSLMPEIQKIAEGEITGIEDWDDVQEELNQAIGENESEEGEGD